MALGDTSVMAGQGSMNLDIGLASDLKSYSSGTRVSFPLSSGGETLVGRLTECFCAVKGE